jgi:hypothetical protein
MGAIVVMDNLPVHYANTAKAIIESMIAKTKFLPTYSPDLSPIELCWSKLKEFFVRQLLACPMLFMKQSLWHFNAITDENALNWFNHCGLFFEPIR